MAKELVSIILPVFNSNPIYLDKSVNSILSQIYDEIELLVVMDWHTKIVDDNILYVLNNYKDDHRLKLIANRIKIGLTNSLNKGIKLSQGNIIGRMDSDDISNIYRIQEQMIYLDANDYDIVGCWSKVIDEGDRIIGTVTSPANWNTLKKYLILHNPFVHSSLLFKKRVIQKIGLYNPNFEPSEDYEFYIRAFSNGYRGSNLSIFLHSWRSHQASILHSKSWIKNRLQYFRCKMNAVFKYGMHDPIDILFLGITPITFFITPSNVLKLKKYLNRLGGVGV